MTVVESNRIDRPINSPNHDGFAAPRSQLSPFSDALYVHLEGLGKACSAPPLRSNGGRAKRSPVSPDFLRCAARIDHQSVSQSMKRRHGELPCTWMNGSTPCLCAHGLSARCYSQSVSQSASQSINNNAIVVIVIVVLYRFRAARHTGSEASSTLLLSMLAAGRLSALVEVAPSSLSSTYYIHSTHTNTHSKMIFRRAKHTNKQASEQDWEGWMKKMGEIGALPCFTARHGYGMERELAGLFARWSIDWLVNWLGFCDFVGGLVMLGFAAAAAAAVVVVVVVAVAMFGLSFSAKLSFVRALFDLVCYF
ncbi:uncharacterized protein K452DRAFT_45469 [Aplosporella prunicola CBS 121167]|uniref:Uncharacterized protein n=1 Tax=Aplosporella prunicola CBS 121167 TaxID=1176127 RepID=A0A6A6BF63_9PEZI|nr:uncharacterized protein K452DRAFT_45469 [Aplosporella prunicola CBS 121167]KAF2141111.1 hypothetical protein K452DRAFT_45469 [Aplosporella prunicola CBS 121167]